MGVFQEFKKFALRGNVIDMAVGIIIGGAFTTVVKSLVSDVIMPPIGLLTGEINFQEQTLAIGEKTAINYGAFVNNVVTFVIVAWAAFLLVKGVNIAEARLRLGEQPPEEAPPPPENILLLREIRDALKSS